jgi:glyoxylase-like metal-dependent hydrolase (beta-lactamase superfamily II)
MTKPATMINRRDLMSMAAAAAATGSIGAPAWAAAPLAGSLSPHVRRVKLGNFEITTILDGYFHLDGPYPIFGENVSAEEVKALAAENFLPPEKLEIGFTPTIVNTGKELVLFDAGNGSGRGPTAGLLLSRLAEAGFTPEQIDVVVLTHFHFDHIGGLMVDGKPAFPNARYVTSATEYNFWTNPDLASNDKLADGHKLVMTNIAPFAEKTTFLDNEGTVVSGITALSAFGHTPGHNVFHVESEGKRLLITADTSNHFVVSLQRPDWQVRFDMDKEQAVATRKKVFGMLASDRLPFIGYHMPFPAIGYVAEQGPGYRFVPASYQFDL